MQDEAGVNRLSIVSLDEIFSNTSPSVGAMACTQALGNLFHSLSAACLTGQPISGMRFRIFTSVLKLVPEVARTYGYVLKPGFSTQNAAFDILRGCRKRL